MNAKDIVSKEFEVVKRGGYDAAQVDTFLRDVSVEFKKLRNENEELEKKLEVLAEKIREYYLSIVSLCRFCTAHYGVEWLSMVRSPQRIVAPPPRHIVELFYSFLNFIERRTA